MEHCEAFDPNIGSIWQHLADVIIRALHEASDSHTESIVQHLTCIGELQHAAAASPYINRPHNDSGEFFESL